MRLEARTRAVVFGCFFLSGATGLAYQAIWFRHLQALFGVTTQALAVVVAAFMGGLAAGAWVFGGIADRSKHPLRLYGWLEIGVAILAPLVAPLLTGIERIYVALHPSLAEAPVALAALRLGLALVALLGPTLLMGGTLPALTVLLRRESPPSTSLHRDLARLYGLNTLGAVAGTALVGFVLLSAVGLRRTTLIAAAANLVLGALCVWRGSKVSPPVAVAAPAGSLPGAGASALSAGEPPLVLRRFAIIAFAVSGGLSLVYEVAWTRVLTQIVGSSTYAFSLILTAFLLGLGLGSLAIGGWRGRDRAGLAGFCAAELGIGATAAAVVPLFVRLPDLLLQGLGSVQSIPGVLGLQFALCLGIVLLPTLCMGATLPLVAGFVAAGRQDVGHAVGRLYAGNTVGGIVGSILAGFVLIPHLGSQRTLDLALLGNAAIAASGLVLLVRFGRQTSAPAPAWRERLTPARVAMATVAVGLLVVGLATPAWDPYVLDAGIAIGGPPLARSDAGATARDIARGSDMLFYREGRNANISVRKDETQFYLKTNGKTDGTTRGDMPTQLMLGLLPTLVHPAPVRTLVVGLGTGASARAAARAPSVERLDVVEIEPAVVEASQRYFGEVNSGLFEDARVHVVVDDARAFLRTTRERYDIVVSEPSNPWIAGIANLFSVDHYERCAARMAPDGIITQWLQTYAMRPELVRMVLGSMQQVFPHLQVWSFHYGDLIVLGSRTPFAPFDVARTDARLHEWGLEAQVHDVLGVHSAAGLLGFFALGEGDIAPLVAGTELNTEDRPRLEFAAPRSLYLSTRDANAALLARARRTPLPPLAVTTLRGAEWLDVGRAALATRRTDEAAFWLGRARAIDSLPAGAAELLAGRIAMTRGATAAAQQEYTAAVRLAPEGLEPVQELSRLYFMQGQPVASEWLDRAGAPRALLQRDTADLALQLLEAAFERGSTDSASRLVAALFVAAENPGAAPGLDAALRARLTALVARAALAHRDPATAAARARDALAINAQCTAAWRVLAELEYQAQRYPEAITWWERLVDFRQTGPEVLVPLARAYRQVGRLHDARRVVRRALAQDPRQPDLLRLRDELGT